MKVVLLDNNSFWDDLICVWLQKRSDHHKSGYGICWSKWCALPLDDFHWLEANTFKHVRQYPRSYLRLFAIVDDGTHCTENSFNDILLNLDSKRL